MDAEFYRGLKWDITSMGYAHEIEWQETAGLPNSGTEFANEAIYVICNSGMKQQVARRIYDAIMPILANGKSSSKAFGHKGKCGAIDFIWAERERLFKEFFWAEDKLEFLGRLPWIGPITKYHLAKNFGLNVCKPDRHLVRIAQETGETPEALCARLSEETGDRICVVDLVLWRAANLGLIETLTMTAPVPPVPESPEA